MAPGIFPGRFLCFLFWGVDEPPQKEGPNFIPKNMAHWGSSFTYILSILIRAVGKYIPYMKGYGVGVTTIHFFCEQKHMYLL